jgi:tetratricopeptide (TPR) repeat protein
MARGDFQKAGDAFQKAASNDPKAADPWIHLGLLRMRQAERPPGPRTRTRCRRGVGFFREALNRDGTRALAWYNQGVVFHRLGRWTRDPGLRRP